MHLVRFFGGWLMSQVDIVAHRHVGNRVVTVAVNEFIFIKHVLVGDLISIYADIVHIGNTSIRIAPWSWLNMKEAKIRRKKLLKQYSPMFH